MKTAYDTRAAGQVLVDQRWLAARLDDPQVRVIEVDVSAAAYNDWHINGAVLWNVYTDLKDEQYRSRSTAELQALVARSGIGPDSTVVFYGYAPAVGFWLMRLYGHRDVRILDCSRDTWQAGGLPRSSVASEPRRGHLLPRRAGPAHHGRTWLRCATPSAGRAPRCSTSGPRPNTRGNASGHPAAWTPTAGQATCRRPSTSPSMACATPTARSAPPPSCAASFPRTDLDGDDELITYCTIGGRAATAWFALTQLLGRDHVRVYDGSWAEWGRTPGTPVTR